MSAAPINAIATRAACEPFLRQVYKWRHLLEGSFLIYFFKTSIAFKATRKSSEIFQIKRAYHLLDLFFVIAALNEKTPIWSPGGQLDVSRQDEATLRIGN